MQTLKKIDIMANMTYAKLNPKLLNNEIAFTCNIKGDQHAKYWTCIHKKHMSWLMSNMQSLHKYHGKRQASLKEAHIMANVKYAVIAQYWTDTENKCHG